MNQAPDTPMTSARELTAIKHDIIKELFLKTADQIYVVARWCFLNRLYLDFYWNAVHALEKYLKAVLLMNGRSAKAPIDGPPYGHNIVRLFEQVSELAATLLPSTLTQPDELQMRHGRDESIEHFLRRIHDLGQAENRYNIFGFSQQPADIYKLDTVVFAIRQLCVPLDALYFGGRPDRPNDKTFRQMLAEHPRAVLRRVGTRFFELVGRKDTPAVREAALTHNLPFAPTDFDHGALANHSSGDNPVLYRRIIVYAERGTQSPLDALGLAKVCDWLIADVQLSPDVKGQIHLARTKLLAQSRKGRRNVGEHEAEGKGPPE